MLTLRLTALYLLTTALSHSLYLTAPDERVDRESLKPNKFYRPKPEEKRYHDTHYTGRRPQRALRAR